MKEKKESIIDYKLFAIYIHELFRLADEIKNNCEKIFNDTKVHEDKKMIQVSPKVHSNIIYVLINAANLKKLVFTHSDKSKNESKQLYEFRIERSRILRELLDGIEITEIRNNRVRNTLEHFDEYIDKENIKFKNTEGTLRAAYNMTLTEWDIFNPRLYPIRLYIANERKFYNMGFSIDIGKIYEEAEAIIERLNNLDYIRRLDGPGGLLIDL